MIRICWMGGCEMNLTGVSWNICRAKGKRARKERKITICEIVTVTSTQL